MSDSDYSLSDTVVSEDYSNLTAATNYSSKIKDFQKDSRWKNGATWKSTQKPKLSSYSATGCAAYAADFCKYVFGKSSYKSGTKFTSASKIKSGDVIHVTGSSHWIVVLSRSGNKLTTAEGNWGGKVVISSSTYTLKDGKTLYRNGSKFRTFDCGYHMQ